MGLITVKLLVVQPTELEVINNRKTFLKSNKKISRRGSLYALQHNVEKQNMEKKKHLRNKKRKFQGVIC